MRRRWLIAAGALLVALATAATAALLAGRETGPEAGRTDATAPETVVRTATVPEPPPQTEPPPATAAPPPEPGIPGVEPPWRRAGAFVWHETAVSPEQLAADLNEHGFGWAALHLHDGLAEDAVEDDWIARYRRAGGPPLGAWGVLRDAPEREAQLAAALLRRHGLGFYVANAEAEYGPAGDPARSRRYVDAFRAELPDVPAALSSLCRPGDGFDLAAWRDAGFAFLPQAYVNQFGPEVAPAACVAAAVASYPRERVHPTVGTYVAPHDLPADEYGRLLAEAGTVGFSVYLAETDMRPEEWDAFGEAIGRLGIAA